MIYVSVHNLKILSEEEYKAGIIEQMRQYWEDDMDEDDREEYGNDFDFYVNETYDDWTTRDGDFEMFGEKYRQTIEGVSSVGGTIQDLRNALDEM